MSLNLGAMAGAAGGSLEDILKQKFLEQIQKGHLAIAKQTADDNSEYRRIAQQQQEESRRATIHQGQVAEAGKAANTLDRGEDVTPGMSAILRAGDLGGAIKAPTLASTNLSGVATATGNAPAPVRIARTANPGRGETYQGTAPQRSEWELNDQIDGLIKGATDPRVRSGLQMVKTLPIEKRATAVTELLKEQGKPEKPTTQPVMRVNPRTGTVEQIGEGPANAHWATEPAPRDTTASDAARSARSYQYHAGALDKLRTPVEAKAGKIAELNDMLAQGTPQADALVAPKLLSVLVGGQGSGLRLNEAEIARVLNGRSKWEDFKAAATKWSTDPKAANSITADQRQQMHDLVKAVEAKNAAALQVLDEAGDALAASDDPQQHKQVLNGAHKKLTAITTGGARASAPAGGGGFQVIGVRDK